MKSILKKVTVAAIAVLTASTAYAVVLPFDVEAPKWTMVAECETEGGINIRQQPSTTAARTVVDESNIDDYDIPLCEYTYWSKAPARGSVSVYTFQGEAPIVSEKNGWLELYGIGPKNGNGWVSAKFCKKRAVVPFTNPEFVRVFENGGQKYAVNVDCNEMTGILTFYVGKYVNGFLVCPYAFVASGYNYSENGKTYFEGDCLYFTRAEDEYTPNASKLPQNVIDYIIRKATPISTPKILFD